MSEFAEVGIPAAEVRTYAQAAGDPHVHARDMLQPTRSAEGEIPAVGPVAKLSRTPTRVRAPAPSLGQHNREILGGLGWDDRAIDELRANGTI